MNLETHYVPKIEEFHVGFEYELLTTVQEKRFGSIVNTKQFRTKIMKDLSNSVTYNLKEDLKASWVRVKYLDKEDIKSFGFFEDKVITKDNQWGFQKDNICLFYNYVTKELGLFTRDPSISDIYAKFNVDPVKIQSITVKNKSELKNLLKRIKWELNN